MSKEAQEKVPDGEGTFNLEGILHELGSFGKYQLLLLILLAFRDSFLAMCNFNYVFTAPVVDFRCVVPECEALDSSFNATWSRYALPRNTHECYRMARYNDTEFDPFIQNQHWNKNMSATWCAEDRFDGDRTERCTEVVYENYNSITAEFNLGCEPWKRTLIGTVHNLGLVFSFILSGLICDRYGRKVVIVVTPLVVGVVGVIKSFSVNYWMLLVLEFLETALGYGNASMLLSLETVTQNQRVVFSCLNDILSNVGAAFFGLIAYKIPYWRYLMRAIYAPLLVVVFYIFLVDEGVRWLLAHNKNNEAVRVLNKVAKINNVTLSSKAKAMLMSISETEKKNDEANPRPQASMRQILNDLRSRTILLRVALIAACFACCMFVYNGSVIYSVGISSNPYINYTAVILVSVPTRIITALTLTKFGRKAPITVAYTLCGLCFIAYAFVPKSVAWASMLMYLVGKMCSSYGLFSMNVIAFEVFPTTSRNSLSNVANTIGRIGSVVAPQTPLLEQYMSGLPSIVFGLVAFIPALLALMLPDTSKASLPDDLKAAEMLDQQENTEKQTDNIPA